VSRTATPVLVSAGLAYALFAAGCFRVALLNGDETAVSVGEGLFTLLGATALLVAVPRPRGRALVVLLGTLPLVGWFAATPWNSGPPFLVASLAVPLAAATILLRALRQAPA
jgi:hypothetical protein